MKSPVWIKPAIWGLVIGSAATLAIGFGPMDWKTNTTAERMARAKADDAVVTAMVPFCVAKANSDSNAGLMAKLRTETSSYSRSLLVQTAGWATLGGAKSPDSALATACADRLKMAAG